ncbi:hypothetical protein [Nonomuraea cavernae]|uniref:Uncharacterized protein n=1 Tax=Nonomuraea cavernae TaxID=2045107 RepID=A0A917YRX9_9ACTN|nr:hypothetical protein [Nonomuraea cavernae]MCA2184893.1 hypothetical protein [Nonomuraea cavernae]GGO64779.1 hypothetical protein GCM10012289_14920 [Nonomuraea cavernae]
MPSRSPSTPASAIPSSDVAAWALVRNPKTAPNRSSLVTVWANVVFPLPPLPLTPGCTYRWILEAQDEEVASVAFTVRTEPSAA